MLRTLACIILVAGTFCVHSSFGQQGKAERIKLHKKYVDEIAAIAEDPAVRSAFEIAEKTDPRTIQDLVLLTGIPAPPFKEEKRGEKFASMLSEAGIDSVWTDGVGNVIGLRKGTVRKRAVMVDAHLDTVFPEETDVRVSTSGDTLKAPGIGDDTRGLAVLLAGLRAMNQSGIKTDADVLFAATVGEEGLGDLRGVKHLFGSSGPKIDAHIALDGVSIGGIVNSTVGSIRYRVTFSGPGGHSYGAFGLANPHNALAGTISRFVEEADIYTRAGIKTTYNIGVIGGGTSVNAVPFESWMEVDMRSESPERLKGLDDIFRNAVAKALDRENEIKRMGEDLTVDIRQVGDRPSGSIAEDSPLVQRTAASAALLGAVPLLGASSTNSNTPLALGIPSVTIGTGGKAGGAHSLDEWFLNEDGYLGVHHMLLVMLSEAGISK
ncbi:MAG: peptidase M20 [Cytophagaceae bacterium SCN 52-12]|nr:MAG: peptidase M20 [Cytophagaceae bacterium SCN 52-12]